uniref:Chromosome 10 C18orf63 homolog n=1 Tax=Astyanax mexicanus TaxID=7994 RepID=A0A3B1IQD7_ASTMX
MTGQREQCLFFVSVPDMSKLCSVFLSFQSCSDEGELRNKQIKTCRELLLLCSEAVASPVLGFCGGIRVIMAHSYPIVLPETLQTCLSYSITARLAPSWNRAGQCLIELEYFCLNCSVYLDSEGFVKFLKTCSGMHLLFHCRICPQLEDFDVPPLVVKNFLSSREAVVHTKPNNWCYILPSMKKGQLISISRKIPPESPFHSYTELQKHWTSMYGYQLPPLNEDEVVYCSVYFKLVGEKLFTYPLSCIRTKPLQLFPRVDLQGALEAFTSDLRRVLDNICGFPVQMTNKPQYHTAELSRPVIQLTPSQWPLSQPGRLSNINQTATTKELASFQTPRPSAESPHFYVTETHKFPSSCTSLPPLSSSSCPRTIHSLSTQSQPVHQTPKLVPIFKNKSLSRHVNITKILAEKQQKQVQLESQHISGAAVKRPHCSYSYSPPSSSTLVTSTQSLSQPPLKRVTLPFRKNQKSNHGASVPAPQQPAFKPQPLIMPEVTSNRGVSKCPQTFYRIVKDYSLSPSLSPDLNYTSTLTLYVSHDFHGISCIECGYSFCQSSSQTQSVTIIITKLLCILWVVMPSMTYSTHTRNGYHFYNKTTKNTFSPQFTQPITQLTH